MPVLPILLAFFQAVHQPPIPPDSAETIRAAARKAERDYEYLLRSMAPTRHGPTTVSRSSCDEIVGRFCLTYTQPSSPRREIPPEPGRVTSARQQAVQELRRAFSVLPGELTTAGPLLRYLIEDGRAEEAISAARAFSWASGDSIWGPLLEGYALHAMRDDSTAEARFDAALGRLEPDESKKYRDLGILLHPRERRVYHELDDAGRAEYEEAFWRLADPLYLVPGNERRAAHIARHVWSRLLSERPRVHRVTRWGDDLEELTLRYGIPTSRERILGHSLLAQEAMVEYYHPSQIVLAPEALRDEGFPETPPPGPVLPFERDRARSGYAPQSARVIQPLAHQVARFPIDGDSVVVRFRALFLPDSARAAAPKHEEHPPSEGDDAADTSDGTEDTEMLRTGLFLLDARFQKTTVRIDTLAESSDSVWLDFEATIPREDHVYSIEALETPSRLAGRARFRMEPPELTLNGPVVSDIVVALPYGTGALPSSRDDERLIPRADLAIAAGDTVGLYAEVSSLLPEGGDATRYRVELAIQSAEDPALLVRAARWLGRKLRVSRDEEAPRLAWEGDGRAGELAILAVDLPLAGLDSGLYALELTVTDLVGRGSGQVLRLLRIEEE